MALALVPHVGDSPQRLLSWVGIADVAVAPVLAWTVNGVATVPTPRRPLTPVLTDPLAARAKMVVHSGVFELQGLAPATPHRIALAAGKALMLRFARNGTGLTVDVACYPLLDDPAMAAAAQWSTSFKLRAPKSRTADGKAIKGAYSAAHDLVPDALYGGSPSPPAPAATPVVSPLAASVAKRSAPKRKRK